MCVSWQPVVNQLSPFVCQLDNQLSPFVCQLDNYLSPFECQLENQLSLLVRQVDNHLSSSLVCQWIISCHRLHASWMISCHDRWYVSGYSAVSVSIASLNGSICQKSDGQLPCQLSTAICQQSIVNCSFQLSYVNIHIHMYCLTNFLSNQLLFSRWSQRSSLGTIIDEEEDDFLGKNFNLSI